MTQVNSVVPVSRYIESIIFESSRTIDGFSLAEIEQKLLAMDGSLPQRYKSLAANIHTALTTFGQNFPGFTIIRNGGKVKAVNTIAVQPVVQTRTFKVTITYSKGQDSGTVTRTVNTPTESEATTDFVLYVNETIQPDCLLGVEAHEVPKAANVDTKPVLAPKVEKELITVKYKKRGAPTQAQKRYKKMWEAVLNRDAVETLHSIYKSLEKRASYGHYKLAFTEEEFAYAMGSQTAIIDFADADKNVTSRAATFEEAVDTLHRLQDERCFIMTERIDKQKPLTLDNIYWTTRQSFGKKLHKFRKRPVVVPPVAVETPAVQDVPAVEQVEPAKPVLSNFQVMMARLRAKFDFPKS